MSRPIRRPLAAALLAAALLPSLWFQFTNRDLPHFGLLMDDAIYLSGARSLAEGHGYGLDILPGSPRQTKYPPALSWLVSPIWRTAPRAETSVALSVALLWLCMAAWIVQSPELFGQLGLTQPQSLAVSAILAINPYAIFLSTCLLAEMPMLALLWLSMRAAHSADRRDSSSHAILAGLAAGAAILFRTAALPILPALAVWFLIKRRHWFAVLAAAASLPFIAGWLFWSWTNKPEHASAQLVFYLDYTGHWLNHISTTGVIPLIQANLNSLVIALGKLLWFDTGVWPPLVYVRTALLVVSIAGTFALLRNGISILHLFSWGYGALLVIWNFTPNERIALPLLPLLAAGACEAGARIAKDTRRLLMRPAIRQKAAGAALALALMTTLFLILAMSFDGTGNQMSSIPARERVRNAQLAPTLAYARLNLPLGQPVLAFQEGRTSFGTGHPVIGIPLPTALGYAQEPAAIMEYFLSWPAVMRAHNLRYIILTPWDFELDLNPAQIRQYHQSVLAHPAATVLHSANGVSLVYWSGTE